LIEGYPYPPLDQCQAFATYGIWDAGWQVCVRVSSTESLFLSPNDADELASQLRYSARRVREILREKADGGQLPTAGS
jgi:hypothetical protein